MIMEENRVAIRDSKTFFDWPKDVDENLNHEATNR